MYKKHKMEASTVATTSTEASKSDVAFYQMTTVIVLSTILVLLLVCLPFILIRIYRRRPRSQRILYIPSTEKSVSFNNVGKRMDEEADNMPQTKVINEHSAEDFNELDGNNHIYQTVNDALPRHIYKNLIIHDDVEEKEEGDVFEAYDGTCDRVRVDVHTTNTAHHGRSNSKMEHLHVPMNDPTHDHRIEKNANEYVDMFHRNIPGDLENIYVEPDYLDMSTVSPKYRPIQLGKTKRKHIGSLYSSQRLKKVKFFDH